MRLDIDRLREVHPAIPEPTAHEYSHRAALALQRRHRSGVETAVDIDSEVNSATLHWRARPVSDAEQLDEHQITEDGAEGVGLVLVRAARSWVVLRRLQRGERADWLLRDAKTRKLVALEVSGMDEGDSAARMRKKLDQVAASRAARTRAACVVAFREPRIAVAIVPSAAR